MGKGLIMSKEQKRIILFGKSETRIVSHQSTWNNDSACLPLYEVVQDKKEEKVA